MEIEREERNGSGYQEKQEFITGIYYEYERLMFATARRYIDDRTEQEDVVQESLKKLIEKQERLAGLAQAAQAGYVATTVRNTAISILREKTKGKYILAQSDKELAADFKCKPDSIRMKLTRARRKLLDIMKRSEEDD